MYEHDATPHDPALGAYEAARVWCDTSADDDARAAAFESLVGLRCDHGDAVVRRVIDAAVMATIDAALHDIAMEEQSDDPSSFHGWPMRYELIDRCLWCGAELECHNDDCALGVVPLEP